MVLGIIPRFSRIISLSISACILYGGLLPCTQAAIVYEVIDLGTLGGDWNRASSINDAGQIVGRAAHSQGWVHATLFDATGAGNNIDLGTLEGGGSSCALSISGAGQIVGTAFTSEGVERATLFDPTGAGNNIDLGTLGGDWSRARSINDAGQIVGPADYGLGIWEYDACLFDTTGVGNNVDLGRLGGDWSVAYSINNTGQIVGKAQDSEGRSHATLFDPTGAGDSLDLGTLGGERSTALAINDSSRIIGWAENSSDDSRATLFDSTGAGNNLDLGTLGGDESGAVAVNNAGQIVGWAHNRQRDYRATLFDTTGAGNNIDLKTLIDSASGWTLISAHDINNSGWIVGDGFNPVGEYHAFLLVPKSLKYSGGTGLPDDPYQIATAEDLILLGDSPEDYDKHFILTADIDLDPNLPGRKVFNRAIIAPDVKSNDYLSEFQGTPFTGVFDGNGYTISNLTIVGTGYLGLFGRLDSRAQVRNVGVVNVNIIGSADAVGGLVGYNYDGIIAQCYSTGAISGTSYVGGLVGDNGSVYTIFTPGARVTDSYSNVTVDGSACVGGLVGGNWLSISKSYSTGNIRASHGSIGGLVGYNRTYGDITYCYASCNISVGHDSHRVGGLVGHSYGEITQCYASGLIVSTDDSTEVGGLVGNNAHYDYRITSCFWDVETSGLFESDGGTGLTTAQIQDPNVLMGAGWDFAHKSDGPSDIWAEPQGGGYPILSWQLPEEQLPALPSFSGGTGDVDDPYLISIPRQLNSIGHNPRLMNAHFKLTDDIDLIDVKFFTIGNEVIPFNGTFDGNGHAVSNFSYTSTNRNYAGFFGYINSPKAEVRNLGLIDPNIDSTTEWKVGSLVGQLENGTITGCYVLGGSVSGRGYVRGLENTGSSIVGGLVGVSYGTITDCHTSCSVFGPKYVGGLLGVGEGTITNCTSSGEVTGNNYIGGLIGTGHGIITNSISSGNVSGNDEIGGLIGINSGEVKYCYSTANVLSDGSNIGGLIGSNTGTITNSYAVGNTKGNNIVGGLVGSNGSINERDVYWEYPGYISNCYSTGSVSGNSAVGGLLGKNLVGTITSSLWDRESSGQTDMCGIQGPGASGCDNVNGKTTSEMQAADTFLEAGWDFVDEAKNGTDNIWWIDEGQDYPRLWWEAE